jgi:hypothetical protein
MHGRTQRWTTIGLAALVLLVATVARADDVRVALYYGPEGPFVELLGAELGLVGFELRPGPVPAPIDESEALALFDETDAAAILDHHRGTVALWIPRDGRARRAEVTVSDDPGIAPLVIAETLRAAVPAPSAPPAQPTTEPDWTPPPPRIATEPPPPVHPEAQQSPPRHRPGAQRDSPGAAYGGRWTGGLALEATARLHPALSVGALAILSGSPAGAAVVRVGGALGPLHLSVDAGPAVWWRPRPANDGTVTLSASPSWTAGLGAALELGGRWSLRGRVGLLRAGPRHRIGDEEGALTLALGLGARF